jgi:phage shock protein PspC (stress-responsive transcriptional regulator)
MSIWHRITVDKKHSKLFGVCSGIANAFGYSRASVRVVTVIGVLFAPVVTIVMYATAAILLPTRSHTVG